MNDLADGAVLTRDPINACDLQDVCRVDVLVVDPLVVAELHAFPAGSLREKYALTALRIGVLALKQAEGRLDADMVRNEGDRLIATLAERLASHQRSADSELAKTLAAHVGDQSALMKILRPTETEGILHSLSLAMQKALEAQRDSIVSEFSLDEQGSALARMKRSIEQLIEKSNRENNEFRAQVCAALSGLQARKEESLRSTRHGLEFEQAVLAFLAESGQAAGDVVEHTAGTTGLIKNCKVGDAVITLGPEHAAAGSRIVVEAKQHASYSLADALGESEQARKNREAEIGVFVLSKRSAREGMAPLARYGSDIVLVWDCEDPLSDVILNAGLSLARALCARAGAERKEVAIDFDRIQRAIRDVEKQVQGLDDIRKHAQSIRGCADKIEDRARIMTDNIDRATRALDEETEAIREVVTTTA